jgi:hypothetical protein
MLRSLVDARDPYIQVAAAVYLCFENEAEGVSALRALSARSGDPGIWAALNLARRGDKEAAKRALEVFETSAGISISTRVHMNLQKRLVVLFSNSAARSRVAQPPKWRSAEEEGQGEVYLDYLKWWNQNQERLELWDPWLDDLKRQKIE